MAQANHSLPLRTHSIYTATGASYLVNGDASGLSDEERSLADAWCERELGPNDAIVDCSEPYFTRFYRLYTHEPYCGGDVSGPLAGDVVDYRVLSE